MPDGVSGVGKGAGVGPVDRAQRAQGKSSKGLSGVGNRVEEAGSKHMEKMLHTVAHRSRDTAAKIYSVLHTGLHNMGVSISVSDADRVFQNVAEELKGADADLSPREVRSRARDVFHSSLVYELKRSRAETNQAMLAFDEGTIDMIQEIENSKNPELSAFQMDIINLAKRTQPTLLNQAKLSPQAAAKAALNLEYAARSLLVQRVEKGDANSITAEELGHAWHSWLQDTGDKSLQNLSVHNLLGILAAAGLTKGNVVVVSDKGVQAALNRQERELEFSRVLHNFSQQRHELLEEMHRAGIKDDRQKQVLESKMTAILLQKKQEARSPNATLKLSPQDTVIQAWHEGLVSQPGYNYPVFDKIFRKVTDARGLHG